MSRYFNRRGQEIDQNTWAHLFEEHEYQVITKSYGTDWEVSTVWLGIDHGHGRTERPVIFESMVFGGALDQQCERYSTEEEARAGHARLSDRAAAAQSV